MNLTAVATLASTLALAALVSLSTGCGQTIHQVGLQTPLFLKMRGDEAVYVEYRNLTRDRLPMRRDLARAVSEAGYQLVSSPDEADLCLYVQARFTGWAKELPVAAPGKAVGIAGGALAAGAVTANGGSAAGGSLAFLAGLVAGAAVDEATRNRTFTGAIDLLVERPGEQQQMSTIAIILSEPALDRSRAAAIVYHDALRQIRALLDRHASVAGRSQAFSRNRVVVR